MTTTPMIQLEEQNGPSAPWVPVGEPFPAPVSNEHLDRAIEAAQERVYNNQERVVDPLDRTYARALIRELFTNLQPPADATCYERDIQAAIKACAECNVVEMMRAYQALKGWSE